MKSLGSKLGYKADMAALLWRVPPQVAAELGDPGEGPEPAFILAFVHSADDLAEAVRAVVPRYRRGGHLWIAYPKKSGSIRSDLSRDHGWEAVHAAGLLGVTQVAIDGDWSALRFRYRDEIKTLTRKGEAPGS